MRIRISCIIGIILAIIFLGCSDKLEEAGGWFKEPDLTHARKILKTTLPLGYAANLAMAALGGTSLPNVSIAQSGDTSVGTYFITIDVDSTFPLPQGLYADGTILVVGFHADQEVAMMTCIFSDLNVSQGVFTINDISTIPVVSKEDIISGKKELFVVYGDIDVNSGSDTMLTVSMSNEQMDAEFTRYETMKSFDSSVTLDENAWIIRVDHNETIGDPGDDIYMVSGGGQYVEAGSGGAGIIQMTMIDMQMHASCRKNPNEGWGLIQNLEVGAGTVPELGHVVLMGRSACDGCIDIPVATGCYIKSLNTSVPLNLAE
jgi:hypothetical protein